MADLIPGGMAGAAAAQEAPTPARAEAPIPLASPPAATPTPEPKQAPPEPSRSISEATPTPEPQQALAQIPVQVRIATARANGYSWDEITAHMADQQQQALSVGYTPEQIDRQLGYQSPTALADRLAATAQRANAQGEVGPQADVPIDDPDRVNLRQAYADALVTGETKGPHDFSDLYHGAGMPPVDGLHEQLPDHADLTDHAIALTNDAGLPLDPDSVQQTKANILDRWAQSGVVPRESYADAAADPILRDQLTRTPPNPLAFTLMPTIRELETGGLADPDAAVSPTGAIGRYQIEPDTARQYGFDPAELHDPAINAAAAAKIVQANAQMFPADTEVQLIAYNAGPGAAERFLKSGRDLSSLPAETQDYLRKAAGLVGSDIYAATKKVFDPVSAGASTAWQDIAPAAKAVFNFPGPQGPIARAATSVAHAAGFHLPGTVPVLPEPTGTLAQRALSPQTLNVAAGMVGAETGAGTDVADALRGWLAPDLAKTALKGETQGEIRMASGLARQDAAQAAAKLEQYRAQINAHMPEFEDWLKLSPEVRAADEPYLGKPMIANLYDFMEGRSSGATLDPASPFAPVADAIRAVNQTMRDRIAEYQPEYNSFYEDYVRHLWQNPAAADQVFGIGRMGSNASLKMRSIPTIADGLAQGLIPKIADPIDNTLHYTVGMRNFLAQNQVLQWGRDNGHVKYSFSGPPEEGWESLKGRGAEKPIAMEGAAGEPPSAAIMRAYAPVGFAQSYNNWVGKGFLEWGPRASSLYSKIQQALNAITGWKLGLSAYHAGTMTKELIGSALASGIGDVTSGLGHADWGQVAHGLYNVGATAAIPLKIGQQLVRGARLARTYLGQSDFGPFMAKLDDIQHLGDGSLQQLTDLYAAAGGRVTSRGAEYQIGSDANLFQAFRRGTLNRDFQAKWADKPVGAVLSAAGDLLSTITAPLFDYAIPRIKLAAFGDEMQSFLRRNPTADREAQLAYARRLSNAVDDRFGEMVLDNVFWPQAVKQSLNAATVSVGWNYGTARMVGTGLREVAGGLRGAVTANAGEAARLLSPEARMLYAYPLTMMLTASVYQYLKTGTTPWQSATPWRDVVAPRTGGTTILGSRAHHQTYPERAQLPGYDKDFDRIYFDFANAPTLGGGLQNFIGSLPSKLNPAVSFFKDLATGKNYYGEPLVVHRDVWDAAIDYAKFVAEEMAPIAIENNMRRQAGSHIGLAETMVGPHTAPSELIAPTRAKEIALHNWLRGVREAQAWKTWENQVATGTVPPPVVHPRRARNPFKRSHHRIGAKRTHYN